MAGSKATYNPTSISTCQKIVPLIQENVILVKLNNNMLVSEVDTAGASPGVNRLGGLRRFSDSNSTVTWLIAIYEIQATYDTSTTNN